MTSSSLLQSIFRDIIVFFSSLNDSNKFEIILTIFLLIRFLLLFLLL